MKCKIRILCFGLLLIGTMSCDTYNDIMVKSVRESLGDDFKNYSSFSYPTDNFGALTAFKSELIRENQICAMSSCLDLDLKPEDWITINGVLDIGTGGSITLTERDQKTASVDAVLPKLWDILEVSGGFTKGSDKNVKLDIGPATVRHINKDKLREHINNLDNNSIFKQNYIAGDLVVIVSDVVVNNMTVTVELNETSSANLEAAVEIENVDSADLDFEYTKITDGKYVFKVDKPVIIMRLAKKQPGAGTLGSQEGFENWIPVNDFIEQ